MVIMINTIVSTNCFNKYLIIIIIISIINLNKHHFIIIDVY